MSGFSPILPTCAVQQVGSYLGYSGHQINVVVTAASDPTLPTWALRQLVGYLRYTGRAADVVQTAVPRRRHL
jgi:hypothetical protein